MSEFVVEPATAPLDGEVWGGMTFPSFRPLLARLGLPTTPAEPNPCAWIGWAGQRPAGLLLAEVAPAQGPTAELLSVFVDDAWRRQRLASTLFARLEDDLTARGVEQIGAVYLSGRPGSAALERLFAARGYSAPVVRKVIVQCTPEQAARTAWYRDARLPAGAVVFPWTDLTAAEGATLRRTQAEAPWIPDILQPWACGAGVDAMSSVGMRLDGDVVGWVLTHRVAPELVRFTSCFVRADLQRRGALFPLLVASVDRLMGTGATCTFVTTDRFPDMVRFARRRLAPFVTYCGESRGVSKALRAPGAADGGAA